MVLEELIERFGLLINNKPRCTTCPSSQTILVIDLALSIVELSPLTLWKIAKESLALSDHELIMLYWEDIYQNVTKCSTGQITEWNIQILIENKDQLIIIKTE